MSERIRILRLITSLDISGASMHAIILAAKLKAAGYETQLVAGQSPSANDDVSDVAQAYGLEPLVVSRLDASINPIPSLRLLRMLYQIIREYRPHIVHTHSRTAGVLGRFAAKFAGVPVIVHTFHEYPFYGFFSPLRSKVYIRMEALAARQSDSIITLTESLRQDIAEKYHISRKSRVTVLPLGLDLRAFADTQRHQGEFRSRWRIPPEAPLIGTIGRLLPVKNHALFLEAAALIHQQRPHAHFVLVGDGAMRSELEAHAKQLNLPVTFTGWQKDVASVYSDLDVSVISSRNEGTPVPVIEALAAGCPVVATSVGGLPDLLAYGELGRLVPSDNAEALANAILQTLEAPPDPKPAQATMLKRYGIDRLVQDMDSLYRGLLTKKGIKRE